MGSSWMQWGGREGGPCDWQNFQKASRLEGWDGRGEPTRAAAVLPAGGLCHSRLTWAFKLIPVLRGE